MTDDEYTPVPDDELVSAYLETLDILRQHSATGSDAYAKLTDLIRDIKRRDEIFRDVETLLIDVRETLENCRPKKYTKIEILNNLAFSILMFSTGIIFIFIFLVLARREGFISIYLS